MNDTKSFSEYMYRVENLVDEFVIGFLSFGVVFTFVWALFFTDRNYGMVTLGQEVIYPWVTALALMLIARELWFINRKMGGEE